MARLSRFEDHRWVGDKRNQVVYDLDSIDDVSVLDDLMSAETYICFSPDTLAEARNRGYRPARRAPGAAESQRG